jgi:phage tail tape-measure protein
MEWRLVLGKADAMVHNWGLSTALGTAWKKEKAIQLALNSDCFLLGEADASELGSLEGGILGCGDGRLEETVLGDREGWLDGNLLGDKLGSSEGRDEGMLKKCCQ